jgi:hypothetical protein
MGWRAVSCRDRNRDAPEPLALRLPSLPLLAVESALRARREAGPRLLVLRLLALRAALPLRAAAPAFAAGPALAGLRAEHKS